MKSTITILGFMSSGKSTMGKLLAKAWDCSFIDLDHYIEEKYHLTIPLIFQKYEENGFRKLEAETLREVLNSGCEQIVSLGGGTPCFENNMEFIKSHSTSIYLKISPGELFNRLSKSVNPRPLVKNKSQDELLEYIQTELSKREVYYHQADQIIESDSLQLNDLLTFIVRPE